jgi:protein required for attachment to host cells
MWKRWIVVAESARARIFEIPGAKRPMHEVQDFLNPEGRAQHRELVTDGHGRFYGKGERSQGHSAPPGMSAQEHEVELFAVELADCLDKARAQERYEALFLIAPPKFLGVLRRHLSKETLKRIAREIPKDLSRAGAQEIESLVRGNPEFELEGGVVTNVGYR